MELKPFVRNEKDSVNLIFSIEMGAGQSAPIPETKPKCKPCCACPETRDARDTCVFEKGEENCKDLIKAHQDCMRAMGFKIDEIK
jgi:cytochrome c oxidase assembly protein subunit 17